jgi:prepilin-type processing-associated H-X9-DG protein
LPDYDPTRTILWQYLEGTAKTFRCSKGIDTVPGSPTFGQPVQLSYAFNGVDGGPLGLRLEDVTNGNGTANVMFGWDHLRHPGCSTNGIVPEGYPPSHPWPLDHADAVQHFPESRHLGMYNVLFTDGHVVAMKMSDLDTPLFYAR